MGRRWAGTNKGLYASAALLFLAPLGTAVAQVVAAPAETAPVAIPEPAKPVAEDEAPETPKIRLKGRVFARGEVDSRQAFARELSLPSARIGVEGTLSYMQAVLEADVADSNILKDAYIRVRTSSNKLRLYAGQFKAPFMERRLESTWELPRIRRGVVADMLIDRSGLGGRRLGAMGELKLKNVLGLEAQVGVFQGDPDPTTMIRAEDLSARVAIKPWKFFEVGMTSYGAHVLQGTPRFGYGLETKLELARFKVSAEALAGRMGLGPYLAGLGALSYTAALDRRGLFELEPVVTADLLQLRGPTLGRGYSATAGVNLIYDQRLKLMLQMQRALRPGDAKPGNSFGMQLAARF